MSKVVAESFESKVKGIGNVQELGELARSRRRLARVAMVISCENSLFRPSFRRWPSNDDLKDLVIDAKGRPYRPTLGGMPCIYRLTKRLRGVVGLRSREERPSVEGAVHFPIS